MKQILALLFMLTSTCFAQYTPYSFHLNRAIGMPSETIYDVFQDSLSFIWFGTDQGICRFDGQQIETYSSNKYFIKSVSNINQDAHNRIWFQDFTGNIFFIQDKTIHAFKRGNANGFLKYGIINELLFIAGKNSVKIFSLNNFDLLQTVRMDMNGFIQSACDKNHYYLVGEHITRIDTNGNTLELQLPNDFEQKMKGPIPIINEGKLYIFSKFGNQYLKISNTQAEYKTLPFTNTFIQNANIISTDFWISSTNGIYCFNPEKPSYKYYYPSSNISNIIKTKTSKYFISTLNEGAYFVENFESNFIETKNTPIRLVNHKNQIYFSTNRDEIYKLNNNNSELYYKGNSEHAIPTFTIDSDNQKLLIGSSKFIIKSKQKTFDYTYAVKKITQLDRKYFAISASGWNGIVFTDKNIKSEFDEWFKEYPINNHAGIYFIPLIENKNGRSTVYHPEEKCLYFLTNYGIKSFKDGKLNTILNPKSIAFSYMSLVNGSLYLLSEDEKIYKYTPHRSLKKYVFHNGFINENIKKLRIVDNEIFFIKGGILFHVKSNSNQPQAVISLPLYTDFHDITLLGNRMYLAMSKGIIELPIENKKIIEDLTLIINSVKINGKDVDEYSNLKPEQNNIEIFYDIITPSPNSSYTVKFKIGKNKWETIKNTDRILRFSSLSYGIHDIVLQVENESQIIEEKFTFKINPPFWMTWWGICLAIFVLIGLVFIYFQYKLRTLKRKNEAELKQSNLEKLVNESKLKSLKSQMNPHFFYNALNTIQAYIFTNNKEKANNYLSKFSNLTRIILEMTERETISISEELTAIELYLDLEKMRFSDNFNYEIRVDSNIDKDLVELPPMLIQPYVENAVKHGLFHKQGTKDIILTFKKNNQILLVSIDDNGIGRKRSGDLNAIKNKNHKSFSTQANEKRLEIINKDRKNKITVTIIDKFDSNQLASGTTVELSIPLN